MVKLLIVDDDIHISDFLRFFFEEKNYQVFTANDGEKALSIVKTEKPNIVFLDVKMPGKSGISVLDDMLKIDEKIKVIMVTGVEEQAVIDLAKEHGACDYITKPFSLDHLENDVIPKVLKQLV